MGQSNRKEEGGTRPGRRCPFDQPFDLVIGDSRNDRRNRYAGWYARCRQGRDRLQPSFGMRRSWFQRPGDDRIKRRDRHGNRNQTRSGHRCEQVDIANHPIGLCRDGKGMVGFREDLKALSRDPPVGFDRLVRIGVRPKRDRPRDISRPGQFAPQQRCRVGFRKQSRLEIQPRRQVVIGMGGPCETVDATMLPEGSVLTMPGSVSAEIASV